MPSSDAYHSLERYVVVQRFADRLKDRPRECSLPACPATRMTRSRVLHQPFAAPDHRANVLDDAAIIGLERMLKVPRCPRQRARLRHGRCWWRWGWRNRPALYHRSQLIEYDVGDEHPGAPGSYENCCTCGGKNPLTIHRSPDQMGALYDALDGLATGTDPWGVIVAAFVGYRQNAPQRAIGKRATHEMQAEVRFAQANSGGCGFLHSAMHRVVSAFVHVVIVNAHILTSDFCEWVDGSSLSRCAPRACPDGQDCRSRRPRDWRGAVFHARQHRNCTELVYIPGHPSPPSGPHPAMRNAVHASVFLPW